MKRRRFLHVALAVAAIAALGFSAPALLGELSALAKPGSGPESICTHCRIGAEAAGKCPCGQDYVKTELAAHKCDGCRYWVSNETKAARSARPGRRTKHPDSGRRESLPPGLAG